MKNSKMMKCIACFAVMTLMMAMAAGCVVENTVVVTDPSSTLTGEIIVNPSQNVTDPTDEATVPTGDVGVGIWDETEPTDAAGTDDATDSSGDATDATGTTEPEPSGSVDVDIWTDPTEPDTKPTEPTTKPTEPVTPPDGELTWAQYLALSAEQRYAYYQTFESMDAFFEWKNAAEAEYENENPIPTIDGSIDLGDLINGNS